MKALTKKEDWWEESKQFSKTKNEEFLDIDETLAELEKSSNVIRLEMNTIELPLFSKNPKRTKNEIKVYHFKTDKSSYLEIEAPAGFAIPGEFEERVFIGLTKIMKKNNYSRKFVVSVNEILESLGLSNPIYYKKIKDSLVLLSKTNYTFFNSLYSNKDSGVLDKEVISSIMNVTVITRKDDVSKNIDAFDDGRVREVYEIVLSDYFYNNIITKGYMAFDAEKLLLIDNSIARSIFTMVEKWRGYKLYLRRPVFFIARRIPLKWNKTQIKRTVDIIEKALIVLKSSNLIDGYKIVREKKWELAEVEITFTEEHNKTKRETFFTEKNEFDNFEMVVTETEERLKDYSPGDIDEILSLFPERVQQMKTMESFINDSVKKYGFDYVKFTSEYVSIKKPKSYKNYLAQALENNWADEYIAGKKLKEQKVVKEEPKEIIEEAVIMNKYSFDDFVNYSVELQEEITDKVYADFLKESDSADNKTMRGIFEKSKKALIVKYINGNEIIETIEEVTKNKIDEITGQYISITKFLFEVSEVANNKEIPFSIEKVAPIFKVFNEFEDEFIKIDYNIETKIGTIQIKGGN